MKSCRLTYLHIVVSWADHRLDYFFNEPVIQLPLTPHPTIQRLQTFDFEGYARKIAEAMPDIQFILVEVSKWLPCFWEVRREKSGGAYNMKPLTKEEGASVKNRMEII